MSGDVKDEQLSAGKEGMEIVFYVLGTATLGTGEQDV